MGCGEDGFGLARQGAVISGRGVAWHGRVGYGTARRGKAGKSSMKESNRARAAFEDYYFFGPNRSLSKLHRKYTESTLNNVPTKHLRTLKMWSTKHGWQERVALRDAEIAAAQLKEIMETALETGYAVRQKRVYDLSRLADKLFGLVEIPGLFSPALVREYRGLLADIAAELGERIKGVSLSGPDGGPIAIDFGTTTKNELLARLLAPSSPEDEEEKNGENVG